MLQRFRHVNPTSARLVCLSHQLRMSSSDDGVTTTTSSGTPNSGRTGPRAIRKAIFSNRIFNEKVEADIAAQQKKEQEANGPSSEPSSGPKESVDEVYRIKETPQSVGELVKPQATSVTASPPAGKKQAVAATGGAAAAAASASSGDRSSAPKESSGTSSVSAAKPAIEYKIKIKKRAPWGERQLRDSWSEDAMTKLKKGSIGERLHREYRYHPDEWVRVSSKYAFWVFPFVALLAIQTAYWTIYGGYFWQGDFQYLLNHVRQFDVSPRSKKFSVDQYKFDLDDMRLPWSDRKRPPSNGAQLLSREELNPSSFLRKSTF